MAVDGQGGIWEMSIPEGMVFPDEESGDYVQVPSSGPGGRESTPQQAQQSSPDYDSVWNPSIWNPPALATETPGSILCCRSETVCRPNCCGHFCGWPRPAGCCCERIVCDRSRRPCKKNINIEN